MKTDSSQISAYISLETKSLIEEYIQSHGVKKAHLIETAILHHLKALKELPTDIIIPPRLVVSQEVGEKIIELMDHPTTPTPEMKNLFQDD